MSDHLFEDTGQPSTFVRFAFPPYGKSQHRRFARPAQLSRIPRGTKIDEALHAAELLRLGQSRILEEIAAVCSAQNSTGLPLYPAVAILAPRRSGKTTGVWALIFGRCITRPNYRVVTVAQDAIRGVKRLKDLLGMLAHVGLYDQRTGIIKGHGVYKAAAGRERIEFRNGARIEVLPPDPAKFRGDAADLIFWDEAGEHSAALTMELLAGAEPLMDTIPDAQMIIAGTPMQRSGMLWDYLEASRQPRSKVGVIRYSADDEDQPWITDTDGTDKIDTTLLKRVHPGIGSPREVKSGRARTTLDVVVDRANRWAHDRFEREYLCRFPLDITHSAIRAEDWAACSGGPELPDRPKKMAVAYDVAIDGSRASIVGCWLDDTGIAHLELLDCRDDYHWLSGIAARVSREYRIKVGHDQIGSNVIVAQEAARLRGSLAPQSLRQMQAAARDIATRVKRGQVRHYEQPDLTAAVHGASWRKVGESGEVFGRRTSLSDPSPLVAASIALSMALEHQRLASNSGDVVFAE